MSHERRREPRVPILLKVTLDGTPEGTSCTGDLSVRGAFIFARECPPIGTRVVVEVSFPGLLPSRKLAGVVRWQRASGPFLYGREGGFGVEWDRVLGDDELQRVLTPLPPPTAAADDEPGFRILVVDENQPVREMMQKSLTHLSGKDARVVLHITTMGDGGEAQRWLADKRVDLLLMDWFLPTLSGPALLAAVRGAEKTKRLPVIVCSTAAEDVRVDVHAAGADMCLQKPIRMTTLHETVVRLLLAQEST